MKKRVFRAVSLLGCGFALQFLGCNSQDLADIVIGNIRATAVDVTAFTVESAVDNAFGLNG